MLDIRIVGGRILDGTGAVAMVGDVGISGAEIAAIGDLSGIAAHVTLDAHGHTVCPGFIDSHSHSDTFLLLEPSAPSKIHQGITTEIVGNCGASAAPLLGDYRMPSDWQDRPYPGSWRTVADYRGLLDQVKPAPNVALLIGHTALRVGVMGYENGPATRAARAAMSAALEQALDEGGRGLSSGLLYAPASSAAHEELLELARVTARYDGVYATHMRSEGDGLLESVEETLAVGLEAGVRIQVSHLKSVGASNWPKLDEALALIRAARSDGVDVAADRYPYTASCTDLDVIFPAWVADGGREAILARLNDPVVCARLRAELVAARGRDYWATVTIGSTHDPANRGYQGMALPAVAEQLRVEPVDAVLHLVRTDGVRTGAFFAGMNEVNMHRVLADPFVMLGTDASLRAPTGPLSLDYPHPRAYGSFPRFLRMAIDGQTVPLAEAIRKMTSLPARQFRLAGRGRIVVGHKADVVVFDPDNVRDLATYAEPHRLAQGIGTVIVNGVLTLRDGRLTGERAGRFL